MPSTLLLGPAAEPIALAEAKAFLRVEHNADDELIGALIAGARRHVENKTRRALMTQTWRHMLDAWPRNGRIAVMPVPVRQVVAARVYDAAGAPHVLDVESLALDGAKAPAVLAFAPWSMPAPGRTVAGIEIDVQAGYGATAADVPEPLRQAIRLLISHWYENRMITQNAQAAGPLPESVAALIAPYRVLSL